ncbi:MAG: HD-GYP domain-containing protein [Elusimicrobiales bacterium]
MEGKHLEYDEVEFERSLQIYSNLLKSFSEFLKLISDASYIHALDTVRYMSSLIYDEISNPYFPIFLKYLTPRNYVISHSVNLAYLSGLVSLFCCKLSESEIKNNIISALCVDIAMPLYRNIYEQEKQLTSYEREVIKSHVKEGADISEKIFAFEPDIRDYVYNTVMNSHERCDGSGYFSKRSDEIPLSSLIIGMCDFYETLSKPRPWRRRFSEPEIIDLLSTKYKNLFVPQLFKGLVSSLGIYPAGSFVRLSTGEIAEVLFVNRDKMLKPTVKVIADPSFHIVKPYILNLMDYPLISVESYIKWQDIESNNRELMAKIEMERLWIDW